MSLSVVLPVFNGAPTLAACLDALFTGLPQGAEVIVVDDGSTDRTAEICARYPLRRIAHPTNRGTSAARNTGWRASRGDLVAFVDADVVLAPDALAHLCAALRAEPETLGANGIFALDPAADFVSDFTTLSIHYQHLTHGERVASAFTGLCVLRRRALEQMGGWDEHFSSRYADDVNSRFVLPPGSIRLVAVARGRHHKRVDLGGLLKHRFNVGWFYVRAVRHQRARGTATLGNAVLAARYPLNTVCAALGVLSLAAPPLMVVPAAGFVLTNLPFAAFVARRRGVGAGAAAVALSSAEGFAYLFGMAASAARLPSAAWPEPA